MTASGTPFDLGASWLASRPTGERRLALSPAEGWTSLLLLALMLALVGWAIDDSRWVLGPQSQTDFLPWAGVLGVLWGFAAAKLGRGRLVAHGLGAILATGFLVVMIGSQLAPGEGLGGMFQATAERVWGAWDDLVIRRRATTDEIAHFLLVLGILVWGTGQFAAYAAYAHRRTLAAIIVPGTILFVNVSITVQGQFAVLVLFSLAALLFLVRVHVADEQRTWARHRIADVGNAVGLSLRAGLTFVGLAMVGSLVLTSVASSAPLAGWWQGIDSRLVDLGNELARLFPAGGPGTRLSGATFGSTITVTGEWIADDTPILSVTTDPDAPRRKWRVVAYDRLVGNQWSRTTESRAPVRAGEELLAGTSDAATEGVAYLDMTYTVRGTRDLLAPGIPGSVDRDAETTLISRGTDLWFGGIKVDGAQAYEATASVPVEDDAAPGAVTENRLRAAGRSYPADLQALYTHLEPGTAGPDVQALLATILAASDPRNPYDTARAIEAYLRDPANFSYSTNVLDADCGERGIADCFALTRRGYCEHYASTMIVLLRMEGIPARLVEGYLPGDPGVEPGEQVIRKSNAHAWVEVYFPEIGWVDFDPTGGGVGEPRELPVGPPVATPTPAPSGGGTAGSPRPTGRDGIDEPAGPTEGGGFTPRTPGIGPIIVVIIPLAIAFFVAAAFWIRRRLGRPVQAEVVYRTVAGMAGRLGHPRRPTQTVYEYLGTLSDAVPSARPELQLVARSTVETTYGRRRLAPDRLAALGEAQRRLRFALLRLVVRRPGRR